MSSFTCAFCGETYAKAWSDAEALAECEERFGSVDERELAVVCDDCYPSVSRSLTFPSPS